MFGTYSVSLLRLVVVSYFVTSNKCNTFLLFVTVTASVQIEHWLYPQRFSCIPLRLGQVFILNTCLIRNTLTIRPLTASVAAVDRIRPLGGEGFSTALAYPILPLFQSPLFQILLITPVPAQVIIAIFLAGNLRIKHTPAALADDFPYSRVRLYPGDFFLTPLFQRFLIFVLPITVPHRFSPLSIEQDGPKVFDPSHPVLYGFRFLFPGLLPLISHFAVRFPLASPTAVFHIVPGRGERFPAVSADTFTHPACRRLLPVKFCPAIRRAKQSV